jgi:MFS family permease
MLMVGRAVQGAGAISAAVTALLADLTRDEVRTKAMALVGMSIGLMFALSLVIAPVLVGYIGLSGLFVITGVLTLCAMAVITWWTPPEPQQIKLIPRAPLAQVLKIPALLRLNFGVFALHAVQLAMWVALPAMLVAAGLAQPDHWKIYLPVVLASFVVMAATLFPLERKGFLRAVFLTSIGLIVLVQAGLWIYAHGAAIERFHFQSQLELYFLAFLLFVFFCAFNILEASQPSLATKTAPTPLRGTALGVYNTLQSLGFFVGGLGGGWLAKSGGPAAVFAACTVVMLMWLAVAWGMRVPNSPKVP